MDDQTEGQGWETSHVETIYLVEEYDPLVGGEYIVMAFTSVEAARKKAWQLTDADPTYSYLVRAIHLSREKV